MRLCLQVVRLFYILINRNPHVILRNSNKKWWREEKERKNFMCMQITHVSIFKQAKHVQMVKLVLKSKYGKTMSILFITYENNFEKFPCRKWIFVSSTEYYHKNDTNKQKHSLIQLGFLFKNQILVSYKHASLGYFIFSFNTVWKLWFIGYSLKNINKE